MHAICAVYAQHLKFCSSVALTHSFLYLVQLVQTLKHLDSALNTCQMVVDYKYLCIDQLNYLDLGL